jgi:hypothetical protein
MPGLLRLNHAHDHDARHKDERQGADGGKRVEDEFHSESMLRQAGVVNSR